MSPDPASLKLLRFEDAESGWTKIPDLNKILDGKVEISASSIFHVDHTSQSVFLSENGSKIPVGPKMVYIVS